MCIKVVEYLQDVCDEFFGVWGGARGGGRRWKGEGE